MNRASLVGIAVSFATLIIALTILELLRRRGIDPVARIADAVMPPRLKDDAETSATTTAATGATA
jgi:hypothetical protein